MKVESGAVPDLTHVYALEQRCRTLTVVFVDTALAGRVTLFASHVGKVRCQMSCVLVYRWSRTEISMDLLHVM